MRRAVHIAHHMNQELEIHDDGRVGQLLVATLLHLVVDATDVCDGILALTIEVTILGIVSHTVPITALGIGLAKSDLVLPLGVVGKRVAEIVVALLLRLGSEVLLGNMADNDMGMTTPRLRLEEYRGEAEGYDNA